MENECPVCYEELKDDQIYITSCNHKFCKNCIIHVCRTTNTYTCPMCRNVCVDSFDTLKNTSTEELYQIYYELISAEDSKRLYVNTDLYNIVEYALTSKNNRLLDYLLKESNDTEFKHLYQESIIESKKHFEKIEDPIYSFSLALLYYKYH